MDEKGDHRTMTWGRREFVKVGGLGAAAAAAAIGTTACGPDAATTRAQPPTPRGGPLRRSSWKKPPSQTYWPTWRRAAARR